MLNVETGPGKVDRALAPYASNFMIAWFIYFVSGGVRTAEKPLLPPRLLHEVVLSQTAATQHLAGRLGIPH